MITHSLRTIIRYANNNNYEEFLKLNNMSVKINELNDIRLLMEKIERVPSKSSDIFNGFIIGYSFQEVTGEFDLLKFTSSHIVNIELKSEDRKKLDLKNQLIKNKFYLNSTKYELLQYGFLSESEQLYKLNDENELENIEIEQFIEECKNLGYVINVNINKLFDPRKIIISPFNNTEDFISNKYYLNDEQKKVKQKLFKFLENDDIVLKLTGPPGCGKSLILYDFYKDCINSNKNPSIMHCSELNNGHKILKETYNWRIFNPKENNEFLSSDTDIFIIDEAQRKYPSQLYEIYEFAQNNNKKLIISYDPEQILVKREREFRSGKNINEVYTGEYIEINTKIRNNEEIRNFIKLLYNKNQVNNHFKFNNVNIAFSNNSSELRKVINGLDSEYTIIDYTKPHLGRRGHDEINDMTYDMTTFNSHNVIGQEFDKVALILGNQFFYDNNGSLRANDVNDQLDLLKLLYQNITRAKNSLFIIVNRNFKLYYDILKILNPKPRNTCKLKEIENIGFNSIPNSKGVFYIHRYNNMPLFSDKEVEDFQGNIIFINYTDDIRNSIKEFINLRREEYKESNLSNFKVTWIDTKKNKEIFSYVESEHKKKYGNIPYLNNVSNHNYSYSNDLAEKYKYIIDFD